MQVNSLYAKGIHPNHFKLKLIKMIEENCTYHHILIKVLFIRYVSVKVLLCYSKFLLLIKFVIPTILKIYKLKL